jgi:hypothetical protein
MVEDCGTLQKKKQQHRRSAGSLLAVRGAAGGDKKAIQQPAVLGKDKKAEGAEGEQSIVRAASKGKMQKLLSKVSSGTYFGMEGLAL